MGTTLTTDLSTLNSGWPRGLPTADGPEAVAPFVKLDDKYYKLVDGMDSLVSEPPSLLRCKSLVVKGPVEFGPGVTIVGSVTLSAEEKTRVQNRTFEDVEIDL